MEPAVFRQCSSRAKDTEASRDLVCVSRSIYQPRPPYQTGALASAGGVIYDGVAYFAISQFLTRAPTGVWANFAPTGGGYLPPRNFQNYGPSENAKKR